MASRSEILKDYRNLLDEIDGWFGACLNAAGAERIRCRSGCRECCRGLFDITLLDAFLIQEAVAALPEEAREAARRRAEPRLTELKRLWPDFSPPYLLNALPEQQWTAMPEDDETPCPLLGEDGRCLIYQARPMTCRLHGLPHVDGSGEVFLDSWCSRNFPGEDPLSDPTLRWRFQEAFSREAALLAELGMLLTGMPRRELDTFIPLVLLTDYDAVAWRHLGGG
ncbi:MAG: YkgJ family cysteine cluster protein [Deltaproteobacteria bacterium]|nr:YkgJ family cysteine cluster protein [Deltaproteobacteria bacterium]